MQQLKLTACSECKHFRKTDAFLAWDSHRCSRVEVPVDFDYLTGKISPGPMAHCRDINKGHCGYFEAK